jgi:hypothetical protein
LSETSGFSVARWHFVPVIRWSVMFLFLALASSRAQDIFPTYRLEIPPNPTAADIKTGEVNAHAACAMCHLYPDPSLLRKQLWKDFVLPKMKFYLGIDKLDMEKNENAAALKASGLFPDVPRIPKDAWPNIVSFYMSKAPAEQAPPPATDPIEIGLKHFKVMAPKFHRKPALTTAVYIEPADHAVFAADVTSQGIDVLAPDGSLVSSIPVGNIVTSIKHTPAGFFLGCIGHFFPVEDRKGQILFYKQLPNGLERKVLFSNLPRVAHLEIADLNKDGKDDIIASMFGFLTGRFSWFEATGEDQYREHILLEKAGAVQSAAYDFNGDGNLDIAVLFGQEIEAMQIYYGDGKGNFTPKEIFKKPPSYGHTSFDLVDFNKDGHPDFVVANGDNGDYESPPKGYHGIRIYLDDGKQNFKESFFYPLAGAFKVIARDFDGDGDLDIAAVSFFPDYENNPRQSFVYLENLGGMKFKAYTFPECIAGRWLTLDAGDIDGDGDLDIVIGSLTQFPSKVPEHLSKMWKEKGPSVLFLKNTLH